MKQAIAIAVLAVFLAGAVGMIIFLTRTPPAVGGGGGGGYVPPVDDAPAPEPEEPGGLCSGTIAMMALPTLGAYILSRRRRV